MSQTEVYELLKKINGKYKLTAEQIHKIIGNEQTIDNVRKNLMRLKKFGVVKFEDKPLTKKNTNKIYWIGDD